MYIDHIYYNWFS